MYATVGGVTMSRLFQAMASGWWTRLVSRKRLVLIALRQNRDLEYLSERFEAGQLVPAIDGPFRLSEAREAFRHFGAGHHKGKVID